MQAMSAKLERELAAARDSLSRLASGGQQGIGNSNRPRIRTSQILPDTTWALPAGMREKLKGVYDNTKDNKEQAITCSSEVFLRLNLSLDGIQELAKSATSFAEYEEKVTREWELACKQQALGEPE
eukprot:505850-Hanusia_phi.AAC.1